MTRERLFCIGSFTVIALGILLRAAVLVHTGPGPDHGQYPGMDEVNYHELAKNVLMFRSFSAYTQGFLTHSTRSPVYPMLLAATFWLTGWSNWAPSILNLLLDSASILLCYLVGRTIIGPRFGLGMAALYSVFGPSCTYLGLNTPEILSVFLVLLVVLLLCLTKRNYWLWMPAFAVIYAVLIHTRPVFLLVTPFVALALFLHLRQENIRTRLMSTFIPLAIIAVLCLPWFIRNYSHHRAAIPVCIISGWHVYTGAEEQAEQLSVKTMTDYIYAPQRRNYSEGDYFRESMSECRAAFFRHPFRIIGLGIARILYSWSPPGPFYRFLLPKAYLRPVHITNSFLLPLPDFEGFLYVFIAALAVILVIKRKLCFPQIKLWWQNCKPILVLIGGYILVHIAGIPLTQYRFTIEPLLCIVGAALIWYCLMGHDNSENNTEDAAREREQPHRLLTYAPLGLSAMVVIGLVIPLMFTSSVHTVVYGESEPVDGCLNYRAARELQWSNLGSVPRGTKLSTQGIFKYPQLNLQFNPDEPFASTSSGTTVGKLYVRQFAADTPLGIGDIKLNFPLGMPVPTTGQAIVVKGAASNGAYKDIIIDVEEWHGIGDQ